MVPEDVTDSNFFVTGGAGFIGASLVGRLLDRGSRVTVFDNCSRGNAERLPLDHPNLNFCQGDIRNYNDVFDAMDGCDTVVHLAYVNGTEFFYEKPDLVLDVGIRGTLCVLDACKDRNIRNFILASTSEVYQTPQVFPTNENAELKVPDLLNPRYSYGGGKIACELLLFNQPSSAFDRRCIFRPHNVYGPDMGFEHVIPQLITKIIKAEKDAIQEDRKAEVTIQGNGLQSRSFIFIDDFTDALLNVLDFGHDREVFHIGTQEEYTVLEIAELIQQHLGFDQNIVTSPIPPGGVLRRCPDTTKIEKLGFKQKFFLKTVIPDIVLWYKEKA